MDMICCAHGVIVVDIYITRNLSRHQVMKNVLHEPEMAPTANEADQKTEKCLTEAQ